VVQRTVVVAVVVYVLLLASLATPLYEPLWSGDDDREAPIALLIVLGGTHLGVGALVRRPWALLLPVVLVVVGFIAAGAQGLAWLTLVLQGPVLIAITALGWLLGLRLKGRAAQFGVVAFVVAACPAVWAAVRSAERGPHVPPRLQAQLPTELALGNLCPNSQLPGAERRRLRRSADVLIVELRRRPNDLVTDTFYYADGSEERRDITIRELAEQQLESLQNGGRACAPKLMRRLQAALR
jgi:hypothetical protein